MRIIIVAGPRRGKSTLARQFREQQGIPTFCGDPRSKVKDPEEGVTYLPEGIPFAGDDGAAAWIACGWLCAPGPWLCEGHVMARALRRGLVFAKHTTQLCDRIIVLSGPAMCETSGGQETMHKSVMTVWKQIAKCFEAITEIR